MKIKVPESYSRLINKIQMSAQKSGFEAYAAGGFVRDIILGKVPEDLDIMVSPVNDNSEGEMSYGIEFAKILSRYYNLPKPVVFERFGTAKLVVDGEEVEFVMPRKEYYSDNSRNPDTQIGTLEQDALRRDFTVNALFLRLRDMQVLDLTQKGLSDIENKVLRVTDENAAETIFSQDPLRTLRAVRFSAGLNFKIEKKTFEAMRKTAIRINIVSPERVRDELNKILLYTHPERKPSDAFVMMLEIGLLKEILPEVNILHGIAQPENYHDKDVFFHTLGVLDRAPENLVLRLAALLHDTGKYYTAKATADGKISFIGHEIKSAEIAGVVLKRLKYSKEIAESVVFIIKNHMRPNGYTSAWSDAAVRRFVLKMGSFLEPVIEFAQADYGRHNAKASVAALKERLKNLNARGALYFNENLVTGLDITNFFARESGKWVGEVKEYLRAMQTENPALTKSELLLLAKEFVKKTGN